MATKYRRIEMFAETDDEENSSVALNTPQRFPSSSSTTAGPLQPTRKTHNQRRGRANAFVDDEAMEAGDEEEESANNRSASTSRSSPASLTEHHSDRETDSDSESNLSFVVDDGWLE